MEYLIVFGIIIVSAFFIGVVKVARQHNTRAAKWKQIIDELKEKHDFELDESPASISWSATDPKIISGIICNTKTKRIATVTADNIRVNNFNDLISCEVIVDEETMTRTSRGNQVAGAAVDGALFGGIGALAGALAANQKGIQNITSVKVKLIFHDLESPTYVLQLMPPYAAQDAMKGAAGLEDYFAVVLQQNLDGENAVQP